MKELWERLKVWNARRRERADENLRAFARTLELLRNTELERREEKMLAKLAAKGQPKTIKIITIIFSILIPEYYATGILGDLAETYPICKRQRGRLQADLQISKQALFSTWPIVLQSIKAGDTRWFLKRLVWIAVATSVVLFVIFVAPSAGGGDDSLFSAIDPTGFGTPLFP